MCARLILFYNCPFLEIKIVRTRNTIHYQVLNDLSWNSKLFLLSHKNLLEIFALFLVRIFRPRIINWQPGMALSRSYTVPWCSEKRVKILYLKIFCWNWFTNIFNIFSAISSQNKLLYNLVQYFLNANYREIKFENEYFYQRVKQEECASSMRLKLRIGHCRYNQLLKCNFLTKNVLSIEHTILLPCRRSFTRLCSWLQIYE